MIGVMLHLSDLLLHHSPDRRHCDKNSDLPQCCLKYFPKKPGLGKHKLSQIIYG